MSREDELTSPLREEIDDEEEEEVVVKSKIKKTEQVIDGDEDVVPLESHIDTPPNGDLTPTVTTLQRTLTLEAADSEIGLGHNDSRVSSDHRLWDSTGEFGLSGPFKISGKKKILMLEDDMLQWYQKGKEREKG